MDYIDNEGSEAYHARRDASVATACGTSQLSNARFVRVENGVVVNVCMGDALLNPTSEPNVFHVNVSPKVGMDCTYNSVTKTFTAPSRTVFNKSLGSNQLQLAVSGLS